MLLAWPNVLVMLAQAATGLVETWFVAKLGTDAWRPWRSSFLCVMLTQMISAGAMGGGISVRHRASAGRRSSRRGKRAGDHALVISVALGGFFSIIMLAFGRPIYRALGGEGAALDNALVYSNVVFAGSVLLWVMNGLANVIRHWQYAGSRHSVVCVGVAVLVPLSPVLIFGLGPLPASALPDGAVALIVFYAAGPP